MLRNNSRRVIITDHYPKIYSLTYIENNFLLWIQMRFREKFFTILFFIRNEINFSRFQHRELTQKAIKMDDDSMSEALMRKIYPLSLSLSTCSSRAFKNIFWKKNLSLPSRDWREILWCIWGGKRMEVVVGKRMKYYIVINHQRCDVGNLFSWTIHCLYVWIFSLSLFLIPFFPLAFSIYLYIGRRWHWCGFLLQW